MTEIKWAGNTGGKCWECGRAFPLEGIIERADAHEAEAPGFRRCFVQCPDHNCGDIALFPGDCGYGKDPAAVALGARKSAKKAAASRENGKKGGRPRKDQQP